MISAAGVAEHAKVMVALVNRARQGDGRSGQRSGRGGRGRDGRGRGRGNARRTFANNVDITDPHRNFSSEEWEQLGSMRSYVLQLREGGRGGRGRGDGNSNSHSTTNRSTSSVTTGNNNSSDNNNSSPILTMSQPINPSSRILLTEVLKMVAVSAAVRIITTTDIRTPVVRAKCKY
ncbi:hypothetical protein MHU86_13609 [Fragilaria crotonensis]|nr:hypothetical protein MHU86_13609 [Fragilaria crotonensis]